VIGGIILVTVTSWGGPPASASTASNCTNPQGCVRVLNVPGLIDPIVADYLERSIADVDASSGYLQTVVVVDSSGTVISDARLERLVDRMRTARVPVSVWVGPSGAEARGGSAELVAAVAHFGVATMASGTTIGEAGPQRLSDRYGNLFEGDGSLASQSVMTAGAAAKAHLVDRVEPILGEHVLDLAGMEHKSKVITDDKGRSKRQPLTDGVTQSLPLASQLFHTVASPAVAYLMLALAIGLLIFEFFTAGVGVAGLVGAGAGVLAGYGLGVLPISTWALVCCLLAAVAFAVDVQTNIPRFWTAVGMGLWIVGSVNLFGDLDRPWFALVTGIGGIAITMYSGMPAMVRSRFGTPTIGRESMIGAMGEASSDLAPDGTVRIDGAMWKATTNRATPISIGDIVRVVSIDGLTLEVEPEEGGAIDYREMRNKRSEPARGG